MKFRIFGGVLVPSMSYLTELSNEFSSLTTVVVPQTQTNVGDARVRRSDGVGNRKPG